MADTAVVANDSTGGGDGSSFLFHSSLTAAPQINGMGGGGGDTGLYTNHSQQPISKVEYSFPSFYNSPLDYMGASTSAASSSAATENPFKHYFHPNNKRR
uniref:Uncharacterized protein n=1 Tax=Ditylenchus dipsaci TaxID=166011 RepID=A0A915E240_9BILA